MSKKLVTIITDVELEIKIQDLIKSEIDYEKTSKKFIELESQALINMLQSLSSNPSEIKKNMTQKV